MIFHPWHEVPSGFHSSRYINTIVEISSGMKTKYEVDKATGLLKLDRILYSSVRYPVNYGFIPQSLGEDGDPLDILIICKESIQPLCLVPARIIGVMRMIDQGKTDDKILAVPVNDVATRQILDVSDVDEHLRIELKEFFESYTKLENKLVVVPEFLQVQTALSIIVESLNLYDQTYPKKK